MIINGHRNDTVKLLRQFEKLDYKYRKFILDLSFLENCIIKILFLRYINICVFLESSNSKICDIIIDIIAY